MVEITNLLAITTLKDMDEEAAEKKIKKALCIGKKEGYVRSFVDELSPVHKEFQEDIPLAYWIIFYILRSKSITFMLKSSLLYSQTVRKPLTSQKQAYR